jgi:hypothetical protein
VQAAIMGVGVFWWILAVECPWRGLQQTGPDLDESYFRDIKYILGDKHEANFAVITKNHSSAFDVTLSAMCQ